MLATLIQNNTSINESVIASHILVLLPKLEKLPNKYDLLGEETLKALLTRRQMEFGRLSETPVCANLTSGTLCAWVMVDLEQPMFDQQTVIRKALQLLLDEEPSSVYLVVHGNSQQKQLLASLSVYVAWVNGAVLPVRKHKPDRKPLDTIYLYGYEEADSFILLRAQAEGNLLARGLTVLPPNELMPRTYREQIKKLANNENWNYQEYDLATLRKMGAGAFVAVAQGSDTEDAAIVHLQRYNSKKHCKTIALVGKGICFDTGGHNLKVRGICTACMKI